MNHINAKFNEIRIDPFRSGVNEIRTTCRIDNPSPTTRRAWQRPSVETLKISPDNAKDPDLRRSSNPLLPKC